VFGMALAILVSGGLLFLGIIIMMALVSVILRLCCIRSWLGSAADPAQMAELLAAPRIRT
jgi:hypothetical protein